MLIGRPCTSIPEGDLGHIAVNRMDYWEKGPGNGTRLMGEMASRVPHYTLTAL